MTRGVTTDITCNQFLTRERFFFASKLFFLAKVTKHRLEILPQDVFLWLASFLRADLLCIRIDNGLTLLDKTEESGLCICGKAIGHLQSREILCLHRLTSLNALNVRKCKILTEQNYCWCINVIYRLSAPTNKSINDQREQTLHLDTSQPTLNQDATVRQM